MTMDIADESSEGDFLPGIRGRPILVSELRGQSADMMEERV